MDSRTQEMLNLAKGIRDDSEKLENKPAFYHCEWIINKWGDGKMTTGDIDAEVVRAFDMWDMQKKYDEHRRYLKHLQETRK
jgi:hypothetical protein